MFNFAASKISHISIDCIKACPFQQNLFAFAYYQTNPDTLGAIAVAYIYQASNIEDIVPIQCPPLLHILWVRMIDCPSKYLIAAASRQDEVLIYQYEPQTKSLTLSKTLKIGQQVFCLYLDMQIMDDHYQLLVSSNESTVTDLLLNKDFDIINKKVYSKHEYAVWTCRYNPFLKNSFVCGDQVNTIYHYCGQQLLEKNNTAHKGGICDLTFGKEYSLYSGGFDGIVCMFDLRKFKEVVYKYECCGGTIWRVIPNHLNQQILLCNSSEKKFQIVNSSLSKQLWNSGNHHDSLAYAADWGKNSLITASFYDKKLCYWNTLES